MAKSDKQDAQEATPAPAQTELLSVSELAQKHGQLRPALGGDAGDSNLSRAHAMAAVTHRWNLFSYLTGQQPKLASDDYLAALTAAQGGKKHAPADFTDKHGFSTEQIESKLAADKKTAEARRKQFRKPYNAAAAAVARAQSRAKFIKTLQSAKKKGA